MLLFNALSLSVAIIHAIILFAHGRSTNITIDDTNGDPVTHLQVTYTPSELWSAGQDCKSCTIRPELAHDGTCHKGIFVPASKSTVKLPYFGETLTAEMQFNGAISGLSH